MADTPGRIGPKMKGKSPIPEKPKGPSLEQGDDIGTRSVKSSSGFKGLMGRLKKGY